MHFPFFLLGEGALASLSSHNCPSLAEVHGSYGISVDIGPGLGNHKGFSPEYGTFKIMLISGHPRFSVQFASSISKEHKNVA